MRTLRVGKSTAWPAEIASQAVGVLGMRGAGKSNLGRVYAEELFASKIPFVVFDPIGNWHGIRAGRDGKPSGGLPIPIFGGEHGDLQIDAASGPKVADLVIDRKLSCILDLSHEDFSENAKREFLAHFGDRLFRRKKRETGWLNLILEEADDYAPQPRGGGGVSGSAAKTLGVFQRLVKRGRFKGLGDLLITQRSAAINKDLLYMIGTLVVFRTTGPRDQEAVDGWLKYNEPGLRKEVMESLAKLEDGEAWVISQEALGKIERVRFRKMDTFDTGATPEHGRQAKPATLADIDVPALSKELQAAKERARASDPAELRKRVADLERQNLILQGDAEKKRAVVSGAKLKVSAPILKDAQVKRLEVAVDRARDAATLLLKKHAHHVDALSQRLQIVVTEAGLLRDQIKAAGAAARNQPVDAQPRSVRSVVGVGRPAISSRPTSAVPARPRAHPVGRKAGPEAIIDVVATLEHRGIPVSRGAVARWLGIHPNGGRYLINLAALRESGQLDGFTLRPGEEAILAAPGAAGVKDALDRGKDGGKGARKVLFDAILDHPEGLAREDLAEKLDLHPNGGRFLANLAWLRTMGVVAERSPIKPTPGVYV